MNQKLVVFGSKSTVFIISFYVGFYDMSFWHVVEQNHVRFQWNEPKSCSFACIWAISTRFLVMNHFSCWVHVKTPLFSAQTTSLGGSKHEVHMWLMSMAKIMFVLNDMSFWHVVEGNHVRFQWNEPNSCSFMHVAVIGSIWTMSMAEITLFWHVVGSNHVRFARSSEKHLF